MLVPCQSSFKRAGQSLCSKALVSWILCLCGAQVNLDYESEEDMVEKMRIGLALQPLATALFANSPFRNGQDSGAAQTLHSKSARA